MLVTPRSLHGSRLPSIAYIETTFSTGVRTAGTGALIGPCVILTAGHVVFEAAARGGPPRSLAVTLGAAPRRTLNAVDWRTTGQWMDRDSMLSKNQRIVSNSDVGIVILADPIDSFVPMFGHVQTAQSSVLNNVQLNVAGYWNESPDRPNTVYAATTSDGGVTAQRPHRLVYPVATNGGTSGGPVWSFDPESKTRTIRGIHTSFINNVGGSALRITKPVLRLIMDWLSEFHPTRNT